MCKRKRITGLQRLKGLRGFWYYDVPRSSGNGCAVETTDFDPANNVKIDYDAGIFVSTAKKIESAFTEKNLGSSEEAINLEGEIVSYGVADAKFSIIKLLRKKQAEGLTKEEKEDLKKKTKTFEKLYGEEGPCKMGESAYTPYRGKPKPGDAAVAIGVVLALIAAKGSAEKGNSQPYIMLIRRQNKSLRNNELDAAVVEGLNAGDFTKTDTNKARLDQVARRALEEERGLNCAMLEKLGLLHMPEQYYFGYDDEYLQWNFFGTVVVDCTIEELIRESFYFTKDKFESKGILGIPLDPQILYYHLSQKKLETNTDAFDIKMWKHGWASLLFAVRDYFGIKKASYAERVCLYLNHGKRRHGAWRGFRSGINRIAAGVAPRNRSINMLCALLSALLLLMTALYLDKKDHLSDPLTVLSTMITVITCWCVVALARDSVVSGRDIFYIDTNDGKAAPILETRVFRNIALLDGSLAENPKISFSVEEKKPPANAENTEEKGEDEQKCEIIKKFKSWLQKQVKKWCKSNKKDADAAKAKEKLLINVRRAYEKDTHTESIRWEIARSKDEKACSCGLRFIFPLIVDGQDIVLREETDGLSHYFDFNIPYKDLVAAAEEVDKALGNVRVKDEKQKESIKEKAVDHRIKNIILAEINKKRDNVFWKRLRLADIHFHFLLKDQPLQEKSSQEEQTVAADSLVVVGFINCQQRSFGLKCKCWPLSYDLTDTSFALNFKDDATCVTCEYAVAKYVGYKMESR